MRYATYMSSKQKRGNKTTTISMHPAILKRMDDFREGVGMSRSELLRRGFEALVRETMLGNPQWLVESGAIELPADGTPGEIITIAGGRLTKMRLGPENDDDTLPEMD
jgi:hypothetical protein